MGNTKHTEAVEVDMVRITMAPFAHDKRKNTWRLVRDDIEIQVGDFDLEPIDLLREGEDFISGDEVVARAKEKSAMLGQRYAEALLKKRKDIPKQWAKKKYFLVFPGTIWEDGFSRKIPFVYLKRGRWSLGFGWFSFGSRARLLRIRKVTS